MAGKEYELYHLAGSYQLQCPKEPSRQPKKKNSCGEGATVSK